MIITCLWSKTCQPVFRSHAQKYEKHTTYRKRFCQFPLELNDATTAVVAAAVAENESTHFAFYLKNQQMQTEYLN